MVRIVNITPSPMLLQKIGATNLTLPDAIAEIVANSFDAAEPNVPASIDVTVDNDEIVVVDCGIGMNEDVLAEAVRLGVDMASVIEKPSGTKGHFGLGLKTACASLGMWWAVYTRPIDERLEYRVEFDLEDWKKRPNSPDAWKAAIQDMPKSAASPLGDRAHGTAVIVKRLRQKNPIPGPVIAKLGEAFKAHLEQGDSVTVNGSPAAPKQHKFVPGSKVPIDLRFGPGDGLHITGWVAIDTLTHNDGSYGFNIYRNKQLVQIWNKDWFAAHLMTSRIIGEVNMDFVDPTFFKMGLQPSDEWRLAKAEMKAFMTPIAKACNALSAKKQIHDPVASREIVNAMRSTVGEEPMAALGSSVPANGSDQEQSDEPKAETAEKEIPKLRVGVDALILEDGSRVAITIIEKAMASIDVPFDLIFDDFNETPELQAVLNTSHSLWTQSKDREQLRTLAVSDTLLRYLVDNAQMNAKQAAEVRNEWIRRAMKEGWR